MGIFIAKRKSHVLKSGHIETNLLAMGKTYQFQLTYGGENYVINEKIEQASYNETFSMGTDICNNF